MAETRKRTGPLTFAGQVRSEGSKVTWASRQETLIGTIMVLIMVMVAALFFLLADEVVSRLVRFIIRA